MGGIDAIQLGETSQDDLYTTATDQFAPGLERLARAYEADLDKRRDLTQDIHFQLWRSFRNFDGRCSLRTWTYRVAHHTAASHVIRERRNYSALVSLETLETMTDKSETVSDTDRRISLDRLYDLIQRLKPLDRQVIVCYLEEMDASSTGEITGLSPANVAMKIHRIKNLLARQFRNAG